MYKRISVHVVRAILWLCISLLVIVALALTGLRILLPDLDSYHSQIETYLSRETGFNLDFTAIKGRWRNSGPVITLQNLVVRDPAENDAPVARVESSRVELDLLKSILQMEPVLEDLSISGLYVDTTQFLPAPDSEKPPAASQPQLKPAMAATRLENLFLSTLSHFSLENSTVRMLAPSGEVRTIDIRELKWKNRGARHQAQGVLSLRGTSFNALKVQADFLSVRGLKDADGRIYIDAEDISVRPWLEKNLTTRHDIEKGRASFKAWLKLKAGKLAFAQLNASDSFLQWRLKGKEQQVSIKGGTLLLTPVAEGSWRLDTEALALETNGEAWPTIAVHAQWQPKRWKLNISELSIPSLRPLVSLLDAEGKVEHVVKALNPQGLIKDIRVSGAGETLPAYSFRLENGGFNHWSYLPEAHKLNADIAGQGLKGHATFTMQDDELPYGEFFQAPLPVKKGEVSAYWLGDDKGWHLWADKVHVVSPDLAVDGAFRLDMPQGQSPLLAIYGDIDIARAGQTWRYLPTLALGQELTDYLSAAIQGGNAQGAKLLWYGELADFPYNENNGVFQAWVPLRRTKFSFDTAWPPLTNTDIDLLFDGEAMHINASRVDLMDISNGVVSGQIDRLTSNGNLLLDVKVSADGEAVRDYMLATPLVDSVGAALTHVQVQNQVSSHFKLTIPLSGADVDARGTVQFKGNTINVEAPSVTLTNVGGTLDFRNDILSAGDLSGVLWNQAVNFGFTGESETSGYLVDLNMDGNWDANKLKAAIGLPNAGEVEGRAPWQLDVGLSLKDVGFHYQARLDTSLDAISSSLPAPLGKPAGVKAQGVVEVRGDGERLVGEAHLLDTTYQVDVSLSPDIPVIEASRLQLGGEEPPTTVLTGHSVTIEKEAFNADDWLSFLQKHQAHKESVKFDTSKMPVLPEPTRVNVKSDTVKLAGLDWHNVSLAAREKKDGWHVLVGSEEINGEALWHPGSLLTVSLESLYLNIPEEEDKPAQDGDKPSAYSARLSPENRALFDAIPATDLHISDMWLQGYRLGRVAARLQKDRDTLDLEDLTVGSGDTRAQMKGYWKVLPGETSKTVLNFDIKGKNSSDLMGRFGVTGGIQEAAFSTRGSLRYDGVPWQPVLATLNGSLASELNKGYVSGVGGAGKLLGLFSLSSIVRKMQLDFSGVFEDGLAFDEIVAKGRIENGIFISEDIHMDSLAGKMTIKGEADLADNQVNAAVVFVPDLMSGIPVLTAFAVTPQTALYVLAITTVISPVVDAFTQIHYQVTGPIDAPEVKEVSRRKAEVTLSEQDAKRLRREGKNKE